MVVFRQWLNSYQVDIPTDENAKMDAQERNGVFCAVRAEML
jgi:hypothetical protein